MRTNTNPVKSAETPSRLAAGAAEPAERFLPVPDSSSGHSATATAREGPAAADETMTTRGEIAASNRSADLTPYSVVCVSAGHGFPLIGSTARIVTVGKTLQAADIDFRILHFGPSPAPGGADKSGVYRGIRFEYTCARRPANVLVRWVVYLWALAVLTAKLCRLRASRRRIGVYLYVMQGPLCLYVGRLCRLLGLPVVQEMCEWFPSRTTASRFTRWLYRKPLFSAATGFLVISKLIERRVQERAIATNPRLLIHRLTSIVDGQRFAGTLAGAGRAAEDAPHFLWCGVGYPQDVRFLVRVLALVSREGYQCRMRIVTANYLTWGPEQILSHAAEQGLAPDALVFMGRVDDQTLERCYKTATALLLPLWDDDQSRTRMPNKLAEYLAAGRPVVSCKVGDLLDFLEDGVNAYLAEPGNERAFADKMIAILQDPDKADRIGAAGQATCLAELDYRRHAASLAQFFVDCIDLRA